MVSLVGVYQQRIEHRLIHRPDWYLPDAAALWMPSSELPASRMEPDGDASGENMNDAGEAELRRPAFARRYGVASKCVPKLELGNEEVEVQHGSEVGGQ